MRKRCMNAGAHEEKVYECRGMRQLTVCNATLAITIWNHVP